MCVWWVMVEGKRVGECLGVWWYVGFRTIAHQWLVYTRTYACTYLRMSMMISLNHSKTNCLLSKTFMYVCRICTLSTFVHVLLCVMLHILYPLVHYREVRLTPEGVQVSSVHLHAVCSVAYLLYILLVSTYLRTLYFSFFLRICAPSSE